MLTKLSKENLIAKLDEKYKMACKQGMMNDLIREFNLLLANENVSDEKKSQVFDLVMNIINLGQAQ